MQDAAPAEDRDWGAMRGGKFAPSAPAPERRSAAPERQASESDGARDWRARASPVVSRESGSAIIQRTLTDTVLHVVQPQQKLLLHLQNGASLLFSRRVQLLQALKA